MCAWCTTFNPRCFIGDRDNRHESDLVDDVSTIPKYEFSESRLQIEMHDQVSFYPTGNLKLTPRPGSSSSTRHCLGGII